MLGRWQGAPLRGYIAITIDQRSYLAHRLAWLYVNGVWPVDEIDHKDLNKSNNRIDNLRPSTRAQNVQHRGLTSRNTNGYKGVYLRPDRGTFQVHISANRRRIYLGDFKTAEEGHAAYCRAAERYHGEFAHHGIEAQKLTLETNEKQFLAVANVV